MITLEQYIEAKRIVDEYSIQFHKSECDRVNASPIYELDVREVTKEKLIKHNIKTIGELAFHEESELRKIRYMGDKSIMEIKEALKSKGIMWDQY